MFRVELVCKIFFLLSALLCVLGLLFTASFPHYPLVSLTAISTVMNVRVSSLIKPRSRLTLIPGYLANSLLSALSSPAPPGVILGSESGLPFPKKQKFLCFFQLLFSGVICFHKC